MKYVYLIEYFANPCYGLRSSDNRFNFQKVDVVTSPQKAKELMLEYMNGLGDWEITVHDRVRHTTLSVSNKYCFYYRKELTI